MRHEFKNIRHPEIVVVHTMLDEEFEGEENNSTCFIYGYVRFDETSYPFALQCDLSKENWRCKNIMLEAIVHCIQGYSNVHALLANNARLIADEINIFIDALREHHKIEYRKVA